MDGALREISKSGDISCPLMINELCELSCKHFRPRWHHCCPVLLLCDWFSANGPSLHSFAQRENRNRVKKYADFYDVMLSNVSVLLFLTNNKKSTDEVARACETLRIELNKRVIIYMNHRRTDHRWETLVAIKWYKNNEKTRWSAVRNFELKFDVSGDDIWTYCKRNIGTKTFLWICELTNSIWIS